MSITPSTPPTTQPSRAAGVAAAAAPPSATPAWLPAFIALSAIWGASFLFIKVALADVPALDIALIRIALGAITLVTILVVRRERLPRDPAAWRHLFVAALLFNSVPFSLIAFGETRISSVLAGLWNATTPLMTLVAVTALLPSERPTRERTIGILLGFAGVVVVLGPWEHLGGGVLVGDLAVLGASACYGLGFTHARRNLASRPESGLALSTGQMLCATAQLAVVAPALAGAPASLSTDSALSLVGLGVAGTGIAYILNYRMIRTVGPAIASTVTYVVPLFATVLGVAVLGERLLWHEPVGAAVVLFGVWISSGRAGRRPPTAGAARRRGRLRRPGLRAPR
jgi:drug/metabolite transporter (DMT)-like permease